MKIIAINPALRTIVQHEVSDPFNNGKAICGMDTAAVGLDFPRATLFVDDEGLLKSGNPVFAINPPDVSPDEHQGMFCGAAFIMGHDHRKDENLDCPYTVEQVRAMVGWTNKVAR